MKKQKKQSVLTAIIIILVITLIMMIGSIVYEEKINMNKQQAQNTVETFQKEENDIEEAEKEDESIEDVEEKDENLTEEIPTQEENKKDDEEYVGEEESNAEEDTTQSKDEKAIDLVKKEWGNDDSVTFSIEKKNGSKYRVAVRDNSTTVLAWYEVDTETWEVSEY